NDSPTRASAPVGKLARMLFLASQSPRRHQLLAQLGLAFQALDVQVPEERGPQEKARAYVSRVARAKTAAGLARAPAGAAALGADTGVVLDDIVFGKPADAGEAAAMLARVQGRGHAVLSVVWCLADGRQEAAVSRSEVRFAPMDEDAIAGYVATGEWQGKAGGYAIQGRAAA